MRTVAAVCALLLCAGCEQEPSFDERYEAAETSIRQKAADIEADIATPAATEPEAAAGDTGRAADEPPPA